MKLYDVWFVAIAALFVGYFFLEGFDFGIGMLTRVLARNDAERRALIGTIAPVWDGNEVWLITAGGALFAAFPEWYASMFSAFYIPLFLILVALIVRGVSFEYRNQRDSRGWREGWDLAMFFGSLVPAILWGVAFGNIVRGIRLDSRHEYVGTFLDLLNVFSLLGGLTTLTLFLFHGAVFAALKTTGDLRERAAHLAGQVGIAALALLVVFLIWMQAKYGSAGSAVTALISALALVAALVLNWARREGWAFGLSGGAVALAVVTLFVALFPEVLPSSIDPAFSLTAQNASSTAKTLGIMTWVAAIFLPIVLAYQGWTYWVFRKRVEVQSSPS